ncbi:helix-turn-helix domain-containing protein [Candidatus Bathyarchaeota archaeon]|nr:helix-turn-helix domain-containing protein [Candidatus Bathyarchaeota archaeon]
MTECWLCGKPIEWLTGDYRDRVSHYFMFGDKEMQFEVHIECNERVFKANMPKGTLLLRKYERLDALHERFKHVEHGMTDEQYAEYERAEQAIWAGKNLIFRIVWLHRQGLGVRKIAHQLGTNRNRVWRVVKSLQNNVSNAETV